MNLKCLNKQLHLGLKLKKEGQLGTEVFHHIKYTYNRWTSNPKYFKCEIIYLNNYNTN